ncbi:MAG: potassium/proton antiporter, partial [Bacteroidales bacterium]|nr:potassium/proton antiporter [Bacteroidales bacterium]
MNISTENILLIGSILLFTSLIAGKTSFRFGVPVLILFLAIGMLAGSEGIGGIYFNNPANAQFIGTIALCFILFSGGMDTDWNSIKPILKKGIVLSTAGVLITAATVGVFVWAVTDFTIYEGLLLGSIISSTDSAAVFSILRSRNIALKGNLRPILEMESGSNDPMAYVLTIAFTGLVVNQDQGLASIIPLFLKQLLIGGAFGYVLGRAGKELINRINLEYEGLYIALAIALMFFSFSATDFAGGNGFLAVYICAVYLGKSELIHKKKLLKSFDSFAWLMQIVLFLTLGLLVFPSKVLPFIGIGLVISLFLIAIARPVSVFLSLSFFKINTRSKLLISWVGLRGAVPIVFATIPLLAGAEKAQMIFNVVFFISLTSVLIQGTSLSYVARLLHLTVPAKAKHRTQTDIDIGNYPKSFLTEFVIPDNCETAGKQIIQLALPHQVEIAIIKRGNKYLRPEGSTIIEAKDRLFILSENRECLQKV